MSIRFVGLISTTVALLAFLWSYRGNYSAICSLLRNQPEADHLQYKGADKPHHASWRSWYHPQQAFKYEKHGHPGTRTGAMAEDWNILYHLGGNGPWIEKLENNVAGSIAAPEGCEVEQVHMMARHAERYPTWKVAIRIANLVKRMRDSGVEFKGDMSFFNDWELFWSDDAQIEQLTSTGPFSGTLGAFTTGVRLRTRYSKLLSRALSQSRKIKYWASDCQRVVETARLFGSGFFGLDANNFTQLEIISEDSSMGANTLTPGDTCLAYENDKENGHSNGYAMFYKFRSTYLGAISERLLLQNPEIQFTEDEIYAMQEMCGFETTVRGRSPWCDVFTQDDFINFEYARDILHYYRAGPGTPYGPLMGWLWLNATTNLMLEGPAAGPLYFSFVHDGDIAPMLAAADILTDTDHLPVTHIAHSRKWRKSQVSPMGGRTIFELLSCKTPNHSQSHTKYVRVNINDGITALLGCQSGPGGSCPLEKFAERTARKGQEVGDFGDRCGLGKDVPNRLTFLRQ